MSLFEDQQYQSELTTIKLYGVDVVYRRGELAIPWRAIPSANSYPMINADGSLTTWEAEDFVGDSEGLLDEDEPTAGQLEPERGDRIWKQVRGTIFVYEVQPIPGSQCYKYSGPDRRIIRIHSKLIEE
jgi:hypothetical protein